MKYPYLPDLGECDVLGIQRGYLDVALATPMESGAVQTRPRYKRVRRTFVVPYRYITPEARVVLDDFIRNTVLGSSGIFLWVDPETAEEINVRFANGKIPQITEAGFAAGTITHSLNLELEEA